MLNIDRGYSILPFLLNLEKQQRCLTLSSAIRSRRITIFWVESENGALPEISKECHAL